MLSDNRIRWKVEGVWWFTWTDEGGTCIFCGSAGLLTTHYEAKPSWYRFVEWTGGNPEAVPSAVDPNSVDVSRRRRWIGSQGLQ